MSEAISAQDAARLLTLVAPGYFAYTGYCYVLPQRERHGLATVVGSLAISLPFVAAAQALSGPLGINANPVKLPYAALLLGGSLAIGYLAGRLRTAKWVRGLLQRTGHRSDPEDTVLVRTVQQMGREEAQVTLKFKDGRVLAGTPRFATRERDALDRELYLDHTRWWRSEPGEWTEVRTNGGVLVRLDEVQSIELDTDPG